MSENVGNTDSLHASYLAGDKSAGWKLIESVQDIIDAVAEKQAKRIRRKDTAEDISADLRLIAFSSLKNWDKSRNDLPSWIRIVLSKRSNSIANRNHGDTMVSNGEKHYEIKESFEHDFNSVDEEDQKELIAHAMAAVLTEQEKDIVRSRASDVQFTDLARKYSTSNEKIMYMHARAIEKIRRAIGEDSN